MRNWYWRLKSNLREDSGVVVSETFSEISQIDRQNMLWDGVSRVLAFGSLSCVRCVCGTRRMTATGRGGFVMSYEIVFTKAVRNQIRRLPGNVKAVAKQKIAMLSDNPRPPKSRELSGYPGYYRIWTEGKYRLVWHVSDDERMVEIHYADPKNSGFVCISGIGAIH